MFSATLAVCIAFGSATFDYNVRAKRSIESRAWNYGRKKVKFWSLTYS